MSPIEIGCRGDGTSVRGAARIAGVGLAVIVVTAISAEFLLYPNIVVPGGAAETAQNIERHPALFLAMLFAYLVAFIGDVVVAWALYVFLKPANASLSLLAGWCRLVYTVIALVALLNLLTAWHLLRGAEYLEVFGTDQLHARVMLAIDAFRYEWDLGFPFFGIHLGLLGYLVWRSTYVPSVLGILLILAGGGYLVEYGVKPLLFPAVDTGPLMITFFGELVFMVWLLIWGSRVRESD